MPPPRLLPVTFALLIASAACAAAASSQPDPAKSAPATVDLAKIPPIEFYLAKGEADACGPGCNIWIVADGQIDAGAPAGGTGATRSTRPQCLPLPLPSCSFAST